MKETTSVVVLVFWSELYKEFYFRECVKHLIAKIGYGIGISPFLKNKVKHNSSAVSIHVLRMF